MSGDPRGWALLAFLIMVTPIWLIHVHLRLTWLSARVSEAWDTIEEALQRRHAVVRRLVETLRAATPRERLLLDAVQEALDAALAGGGPGEAARREARLDSGLARLLALTALYPELRQRDDVMALRQELVELEAGIAKARGLFNDQVGAYNEAIDDFPCFYYHDQIGFERRPAFVAPPERLRLRPAAGEPTSRLARCAARPGARRRPRYG